MSTLVGSLVVAAFFAQMFLATPRLLRLLRSDVPNVTAIWEKYGAGFENSETFLIHADLLASLYLVEQEMDARSKLSEEDLTFESLLRAAEVPSLFQRGDLAFMERKEVCVHQKRLFSKSPHPCERLRPIHRNLRQMSAYLTLATEHLIENSGQRFADLARKQTVALMVYFCGPKEAAMYIQRGFKAPSDLQCSDLPLRSAMKRVKTYQLAFKRAQMMGKSAAL